jgi:hypothetical protein
MESSQRPKLKFLHSRDAFSTVITASLFSSKEGKTFIDFRER